MNRQGDCGNNTRQLRLATHQIVDCGARIRCCHSEAAEQSGGEVCRPKAEKFAIGIDGILVFGAEAARGHDARPETHNQHSHGAED